MVFFFFAFFGYHYAEKHNPHVEVSKHGLFLTAELKSSNQKTIVSLIGCPQLVSVLLLKLLFCTLARWRNSNAVCERAVKPSCQLNPSVLLHCSFLHVASDNKLPAKHNTGMVGGGF